jgi:methionine sulfoxide reductase heme-binding subunit
MIRALESWRLFWTLAVLLSALNCLALPFADLHTARGTEFIILYAVRCALPLFVVAFTASSVAALWPSPATRWLLSNRRYMGLAFAFGMAWHLAFVAYFLSAFGDHLNATVLTLDLIGLGFLTAMTLTSFRWLSRHLRPRHWRYLHKTGIYAIWLLAVYIYQGGARHDRDLLHVSVFAALLAAGLLRLVAWVREHLLRRNRTRLSAGPAC